MAIWTPFVLCFLFGMAIPVFLISHLLRRRGDSGACVMEFILFALAGIIMMALWLGIELG